MTATVMSIHEHAQAARRQGFYFFVDEILPRWEQFGGVHWSTAEAAFDAASKSGCQCRIYKVFYDCEIESIQIR